MQRGEKAGKLGGDSSDESEGSRAEGSAEVEERDPLECRLKQCCDLPRSTSQPQVGVASAGGHAG